MLSFGVFAVGTDGFVIAGLLPAIAGSLHVSVAAAGQLVTVFAISYAVLAPVLAALTASWSRRAVLVTALAVFTIGNAVTALAPGYGLVLASRALAAAGAALFTATATATAAMLAGERERGRAIAIVMLGSTTSLVFGAPLGTLVGGNLDWRATMWLVSGLGLLAVPGIALWLPARGRGVSPGVRGYLAPLRNPRVVGLLVTTVVAFVGIYMPYTYISEIFAPAIGHGPDALAMLLLTFGIAGTLGNITAGHQADRRGARRVVIAVTLALGVVFALTPLATGTIPAALVAVVLSGFFSFGVTTPQQHRIIALTPSGQSLVTSLYQSAVYLAVSLSGAAGALGLQAFGSQALPLLAAVLVFAAAVLTVLLDRTRPGEGPAEAA
ncbi:MFS transporter [Bailinhaonella thermotolerans]|uniref:MFS transporter n=1 Tax=Bailinhaonella thermotolerans TaxID=1070861 RepID=A0A3A4BF10_9ACTN|nr:MFS transporter [Bailinhaonella thermotolerans]